MRWRHPHLSHSPELQGWIREIFSTFLYLIFDISQYLPVYIELRTNIPLIAVGRTEEYNTLNNIIQLFHQIQIVLFHGSSEESKVETILGLIDVNRILDDRLEVLFKAGYHCPDEIYFITNLLM